jgi:mannose-6-phosphate isomerase-like protein (cupin superfamily)
MSAANDVERPWGRYRILDEGSGFQLKRLTINPGAAISSQSHRHRSEHWIVAVGTALVTVDGAVETLNPGDTSDVAVGAVHRIQNETDDVIEVIEVQYGEHLAEDDITRYEDMYGRA